MFQTNMSSFRCRSKLSPLLHPARRRDGFPEESLFMTAMLASDLPLPRIGRGKVRDIYAVGDDRVLLLTTDRISAFDVVMAETIPMKGAVLTQISAWWFKRLEGIVPHHMLSADADSIIAEVPALKDHRADVLGRAMLSSFSATSLPKISRTRATVMFSSWPVSALVAGLKIDGSSFALSSRPGASFSPASVPCAAYSFQAEPER